MHIDEITTDESNDPVYVRLSMQIDRTSPNSCYTLWDLIDDLRDAADRGYGNFEPDVNIIVIRPHVETETEAAARRLAEATAELNAERSGRRKKKRED